MAPQREHTSGGEAWALADRQHGELARVQLLALGFTADAIKHRLANRRLHPLRRGVYAVGRPKVDLLGEWMAAVLACGAPLPPSYEARAWLSGLAGAALWETLRPEPGPIDVSIRRPAPVRQHGVRVHRRPTLDPHSLTVHRNIPVTTPAQTLIDIAASVPESWLRRAVNRADSLDLIDPERLRRELDLHGGEPGIAPLRRLLDRFTFAYTDSELEDAFLPLVRKAGLPTPLTQEKVNGFDVDFFWPGLGLVVEADSLRYHRTPAQQAADRRRDQVHVASGLTTLRFTHGDIRFEREHVVATLRRTADRLGRSVHGP